MLTEDKGGAAHDGPSTAFNDRPVLYKHGSNLTLHQWEDCADVLVSCQSQRQESFICQYGVSSGTLSWSVNITRTCDMLWVGVTSNPGLNCEAWIGYQPGTFLVSEEATMLAPIHEAHAPAGSGNGAPFPGLLNYEAGKQAMLRDFPGLDIDAIWCSVGLTLNASTGELWAAVAGQPGLAPRNVLVFRGLPTGRMLYPCLSLCNAGQVVFRKHANEE